MAHGRKKKSRHHRQHAMDPKRVDDKSARRPVGLFVVHGVGRQRRGSTASLVASRLERTLVELGVVAQKTVSDEAGEGSPARERDPSIVSIGVNGDLTILVGEGYWADLVERHRARYLRGTVQRLLLLLAVFPFLLTAAIMPRAHEEPELAAPRKRSRVLVMLGVDDEVAQLRLWWPTMWRATTAIGLSVMLIAGTQGLPLSGKLLTAAAAFSLVVVLLSWRWDVVEHIRIACLDGRVLAEIEQRLAQDLAALCQRCEDVWVVGHSQGGYLMHRLLTRHAGGRWCNVVRFTGLGSGLRPIHLITVLNAPRWAVSGWISLLGGCFLFVGSLLAYEPGGPLNTGANGYVMQYILRSIVLMTPAQDDPYPFASFWPTYWACVPWGIAGIILLIAGVMFGRTARRQVEQVGTLPARIQWEELSSASDIVGSMSVPELPAEAASRSIPSARHAVIDHPMRSYLARTSTLRFEFARWALKGSGSEDRLSQLGDLDAVLQGLSQRTYRLRFAVVASAVVLGVFVPVTLGASALGLVVRSVPALGACAVAVAVVSFVWWQWSSRVTVRRYARAARTAVQFTPRAPRRRPTWAVVASVFGGLAAFLGGLGIVLYARGSGLLTDWSDASPLGSVFIRSSSFLTLAAVLAGLAVCLTVAELRGTRALLLIAILCCAGSLRTLLLLGTTWVTLGAPGLPAPIVAGAVLLAAALGARRVQPGGGEHAVARARV